MTTPSPDSTEPQPSPRCRWHAVAIVVTVLSLAVGIFLNIPGEPVVGPDLISRSDFGPRFPVRPLYVAHGWPFWFLNHKGPREGLPAWTIPPRSYSLGVSPELDTSNLIANVVIVIASSLLLGWLTQRHLTKYGFRFKLSNIVVLLVGISCVLAYGAYRYRLNHAQQNAIEIAPSDTVYLDGEWEPFGPAWLRSMTGERYWTWGDRLLAANPQSHADIESLPGKSFVKVLRPWHIRHDDPPSLKGYHDLIAMDLHAAGVFDRAPTGSDGTDNLLPLMHEIARCQTLQGLNFYEFGLTDKDLEPLGALTQLKHLDLTWNLQITDAGLTHLASIKSLRDLGLRGTSVTQTGVDQLQAELPNCQIHWEGW